MVSYEPKLLSHFSTLTSISELISKELEYRQGKLVSKKPTMASDLMDTDEAKWYQTISHGTKLHYTILKINFHC